MKSKVPGSRHRTRAGTTPKHEFFAMSLPHANLPNSCYDIDSLDLIVDELQLRLPRDKLTLTYRPEPNAFRYLL